MMDKTSLVICTVGIFLLLFVMVAIKSGSRFLCIAASIVILLMLAALVGAILGIIKGGAR